MKANSVLGDGVDCFCLDEIRLGEGAIVGTGAFLCGGFQKRGQFGFHPVVAPIVLEQGSIIEPEALVGAGVTVGAYAMLKAKSVARENLHPNAIYVGEPARLIAIFEA